MSKLDTIKNTFQLDAKADLLRLWLVVTKDEQSTVKSVLKRLIHPSRIHALSADHLLLAITEEDISPYEVLEIIETEAMTATRIAVGPLCSVETSISDAEVSLLSVLELGHDLRLKERVYVFESLRMADYIIRGSRTFNIGPQLDDDVLSHTAKVFLESNLNVTDASQKLYIHRNTLLYRLSKIQAITGYDLRQFSDACNYMFVALTKQLNP